MQRREFFKWLAAATGAVYLEPDRALADRGDALVVAKEVGYWLKLRSGKVNCVAVDVVPGTDTILNLEAEDGTAFYICGLRAMVPPAQVQVVAFRIPSFYGVGSQDTMDAMAGPLDMHFFSTEDCYCPFDGGVVHGERRTKIRMRTFDDVVDPVTVALLVVGTSVDAKSDATWPSPWDRWSACGMIEIAEASP